MIREIIEQGPLSLTITMSVVVQYQAMRKGLDDGTELGMPDGVLINGKGPYGYNSTVVPNGIGYETINVDPGRVFKHYWAILQGRNTFYSISFV